MEHFIPMRRTSKAFIIVFGRGFTIVHSPIFPGLR